MSQVYAIEERIALPFHSCDTHPSSMSTFERRTTFVPEHCEEIHSGHYMVSNIDDSESEIEETGRCSEDSSKVELERHNLKDKSWIEFDDLASLFRYLEIAYTGQLTSPKWNQFRGLRFAVKNKIRLNNIIWREYHMQFVKNVRPLIVQFQAPLTEDHTKCEAIVLEGKYWKRSLKTVCQEYHSWRLFAKNKIHGSNQRHILACLDELLGPPNYSFHKAQDELTGSPTLCDNDGTFNSSALLNDIMMDFDETLDLFFEQPLNFPNPKDLALLGIGDIMQPGLLQFEPNTTNPMDDIFSFNSPVSVQSKSSKPGTSEVRDSQESVYSQLQHEPLSITTAEPNQTKSFLCSDTVNSDITMKGIVEEHNKSEVQVQPATQSLDRKRQNFSFQTTPRSGVQTYETAVNRMPNVSIRSVAPPDRSSTRETVVAHPTGQLHASGGRRPHISKQPPAPTLHRHRGSLPSTAHTNEKALKQIFRSTCLDSPARELEHAESSSNSPALLNALLHGTDVQKKIGPTSRLDSVPSHCEGGQNSCRAPLLCSALTTPLPLHSKHMAALPSTDCPNELLSNCQVVETPTPLLLGPSPPLSIEPMRANNELCNVPVDCGGGVFKINSGGQSSLSNVVLSDQETRQPCILKSTLTAAHTQLTNAGLTPTAPQVQCTPAANSPSVGNVFRSCTFDNNVSSVNPSNYAGLSGQSIGTGQRNMGNTDSMYSVYEAHQTETVESHLTSHKGGLHTAGFLVDAQPSQSLTTANASTLDDKRGGIEHGFPQNTFPVYPPIGSNCEANRQRPSLISQNFTSSNTLSASQASWTKLSASSRPLAMDSHYWPSACLGEHKRDNYVPGNAPEHAVVANKEEGKGGTFGVAGPQPSSSLSSRGRSSSAGNLFPLYQSQHNYTVKPSSSTIISSRGSTEALSSPICTQTNFVSVSSPSCSPPTSTVFESDLSSRNTATGNSSEEMRRHSMHTALETLRNLVHLHSNMDGPMGGSRLAARRLMDLHDHRSLSGTIRSLDEVEEESIPNWTRSKVSTGSDGIFSVGTNEGGSSYRATKAATLHRAAEIIREMKARKIALDAQQASLKTERETLKKAISAWCRKMMPSGSTPTRPTNDPYLQDRSEEWFRHYVQKRTEQCWKFYVFSLIMGELFQSYCVTVNTASREHFVRSLFGWLDQHGSRGQLLLAAPRAMCRLSTTTSILRDPDLLPEQAKRAAANLTMGDSDSPIQMHAPLGEQGSFDLFSTNKITT